MKKIIFSLILSSVLMVGCTDFLDTAPYNEIATGNMWESENLAQQGINGIYRIFYNDDLEQYAVDKGSSGYNFYGMEAHGYSTSYFNGIVANNASLKANYAYLSYEWQWAYTGIHRCNDAIANLHRAGLDEATFGNWMSEVRFLRAFFYHRLAMLFHDVPLYTEPVNAEDCYKGVTPRAEIWAQCLEDLKYCIENEHFANNNLSGERYGRPSKGAAYALRGQIYMWLEEWALAASDFENVKKCGFALHNYSVAAGTYQNQWTAAAERNSEMIFPLQLDAEKGYSGNLQQIIGSRDQYNGISCMMPNSNWVDDFQMADGSEFEWTTIFPEWNTMKVAEREVFFARNRLQTDYKTNYDNLVKSVGAAVVNAHYLPEGNEQRVMAAYENRDPRLKLLVLTPYAEMDCYEPSQSNGNQVTKVFRYPFITRSKNGDANGWDLWHDKRKTVTWFYLYRKYNETQKDAILSRAYCHTDIPIIRYTDIQLQWAEALVQQNKIAEAVALINEVRTRGGMPALHVGAGLNGVSNEEETLAAIRYESRIELCCEGVNYFHEVRWGTYHDSKFQGQDQLGIQGMWGNVFTKHYWHGEQMLRWAIPAVEQQRNSNLPRTEGWQY